MTAATVAVAGVLAGALGTGVPQASAATGTLDEMFAFALTGDPGDVTSAYFPERPPTGTAFDTRRIPNAGFPRAGEDYAVISTGNAGAVGTHNDSTASGVNNHGAPIRGGAQDTVIFRVDVDVPAGRNCARIDFRFLSEEYPELLGDASTDAFVIELDQSTWTVWENGTVYAPDNVAFDPYGSPITINAVGPTALTPDNAAGTTFDGATPLLTATTPIDSGTHAFYFSIFDVGGPYFDSAAFIDDLRFSTVADPETECLRGAMPATENAAIPLVGAHGITGSAEDMDIPLGRAEAMVPTLTTMSSAPTGAITSVWANGDAIVREAVDVMASSGQPLVNVIAHSKGGLDSRVAMWQKPKLFRSLGMLATPNAGSNGADSLCRIRNTPTIWWRNFVVSSQGPCNGPGDGLYNLQTAYVTDVFNEEVGDWPQHNKYVVAGDCWSWKCLGLSQSLAVCDNSTLELQGLYDGSDSVVCVSSAFARSPLVLRADTGEANGTDEALLPTYGLDHTQMRESICPTSQLLHHMYGTRNVANPYSDGSCSGGGVPGDPGDPGGPVPSLSRTAGSSEAVPDLEPAERILQSVDALQVTADAPAVLDIVPEGAGGAAVELWSDAPLDVVVTDADGAVDEAVEIGSSEQDGAHVTTVEMTAADGAPRSLEVTSATDVAVGVLTYVAPGEVRVDATVEPVGPDAGLVRVTVSGLAEEVLAASSLSAWSVTDGAPVTTAMLATEEPGVFEASVPLRPGVWTPVYASLTGPVTRQTDTGVITDAGGARIEGATGDSLVDTDGDGTVDTLSVDVAVQVDAAGTYELGADFSTASGVAFSAPATADLGPGDTTLTLQAPIAALIAGGEDGPYTLTDGILTRTTPDTRTRVATADDLGTVGAHPVTDLPVDQLGLYAPALTQDGDTIRSTARAAIVSAGTYRISGTLLDADGARVQVRSTDIDLASGTHDVGLDFPTLGMPDGTYRLDDLTLTRSEDPDDQFIARPATVEYTGPTSPPAAPVLRSERSLVLTSSFATTGPDGDVVTAGDFSCSSAVYIGGDLTAAGDVTMTDECRVDGDVRAGGSLEMRSTASVGGDVVAVGDVSLEENVRIEGSVTTAANVTSVESHSVAELQELGVIRGEVASEVPVEATDVAERTAIGLPEDGAWADHTSISWMEWMNEVATANAAPSWSPGLSASPGCVMGPWRASVNGSTASIGTATVVDARAASSGCGAVALKGMELELGADLVLIADHASFTRGLTVTSSDGEAHRLSVVTPSEGGCVDPASISVTDGVDAAPEIEVDLISAGKAQLEGATTMAARVDVECLESSGPITLVRAPFA